MIKHVVFFKLKPDATDHAVGEVLDELESLPGKIDVIRRFEVGRNILPSARAWDVVIIGEYDSLDDLETYATHPAHVAVAKKIQAIRGEIGAVDYEMTKSI